MLRSRRNLALVTLLAVGALVTEAKPPDPEPKKRREYHVSPDGTARGDGSLRRPWDLKTALSHPSAVGPGDVLWLHAGTYAGPLRSVLHGSPAAPIVVREWPGEHATIDGAPRPGENTLTIEGSDTWYWGFEVTNSNPVRVYTRTNTWSRGEGLYVRGPRTRLINLVVHDTQDGIGLWEAATDAEVAGCILYHNGVVDPGRGQGHGVYIQARDDHKRVRDVVSFANFATGMKAFAEHGFANNVAFEGVVAFDNKAPATFRGNPARYSPTERFCGIFVGTSQNPVAAVAIRDSIVWNPPGSTVEYGGIHLGHRSPQNGEAVLTGNVVGGGNIAVSLTAWKRVTFMGNTLWATSPRSGGANEALVEVEQAPTQPSDWDDNVYHDATHPLDGVSYPFVFGTARNRFGNALLSWSDWRRASRFDSRSRYAIGAPGVRVIVRPNPYESGRAHIAVLNPGLLASLDVDLSSVLKPGSRYEIRNVRNLQGPPLRAGAFDGGKVSLPLVAGTPTAPIGLSAEVLPDPTLSVFLLTSSTGGPETRDPRAARP